KQKTAYEIFTGLEFRRVLFRSGCWLLAIGYWLLAIGHQPSANGHWATPPSSTATVRERPTAPTRDFARRTARSLTTPSLFPPTRSEERRVGKECEYRRAA